MKDAELEAALQGLHQEYAQALPERVNQLQALWRELGSNVWSREQFGTFIRLAHQLAGSGTTYGFPRVTESARALELYSKSLNADHMPTAAERAEINRRLAMLCVSWD